MLKAMLVLTVTVLVYLGGFAAAAINDFSEKDSPKVTTSKYA
jgi:hypothetical protein